MKNEDEKLREAARMLSVNCEGYRDACRQKLSKQAAKNLADKPLKPWKFGGQKS